MEISKKILITIIFSITFGALSYLIFTPLEKYFSHPELLEYVSQTERPFPSPFDF